MRFPLPVSLLVPMVATGALVACGTSDQAPPWPPLEPIVRPEHPRPDFRRESFVNLNTRWEFAYDPDDVGLAQGWQARDDVWTDRIQVPYAWESPLSGLVPPHEGDYSLTETLKATTYRGVAWYRLRLPDPLPHDDGLGWHLVFGAVDFHATVWVGGQHKLEHVGGYAPFSVDLGEAAEAGRFSIVVRVEDLTELSGRVQPVGKQGGTWYTRTSGIWQTVYLEQRPEVHLQSIRLTADLDAGELEVLPKLNEPVEASIRLAATVQGQDAGLVEQPFAAGSSEVIRLPLDPLKLWDHGSPTLYDLDVEVRAAEGPSDLVHTYFGMVETSTQWLPGHGPTETPDPADQYQAFHVNGRPRYLRCVLDQSYHPDGVYTAPDLEAIRADLELARSFGFNCIRLHIKADEPVKYRLLDELGFYVVYDIPSLELQAKNTEGFAGRAHFEQGLRAAIARDANHPSVIAWVVFNENWGLVENGSALAPTPLADSPGLQQWVRDMVGVARALDPTRPVEDNSAGGIVGRFEHIDTDSNSFHYYGEDAADYRAFLEQQAAATYPGSTESFVGDATQDGDPWWNSEFASFSTLGEPAGADIFCDLFGLLNEMRRQPKLVGWVLTQLSDVEYERNGLVTYQREAKPDLCERYGVGLADVLGDDFIAFDWLPGETLAAGATVDVPLGFSHWSSASPAARRLLLRWGDGPATTLDFQAEPFEIVPLTLTLTAPAQAGPSTLVAEVQDEQGSRLCANRLDVVVE